MPMPVPLLASLDGLPKRSGHIGFSCTALVLQGYEETACGGASLRSTCPTKC